MKIRWFLYWTLLCSALAGVLLWKNNKFYPTETKQWKAGKSAIEFVMLILATTFLPAILVVYSSMFFTKGIKRPGIKIGAGFLVGTILMMSVGFALELLVLAGAFAVNLISDDFLSLMEERRIKRGIREVMEGRT